MAHFSLEPARGADTCRVSPRPLTTIAKSTYTRLLFLRQLILMHYCTALVSKRNMLGYLTKSDELTAYP